MNEQTFPTPQTRPRHKSISRHSSHQRIRRVFPNSNLIQSRPPTVRPSSSQGHHPMDLSHLCLLSLQPTPQIPPTLLSHAPPTSLPTPTQPLRLHQRCPRRRFVPRTPLFGTDHPFSRIQIRVCVLPHSGWDGAIGNELEMWCD